MARYYFHTECGGHFTDTDGEDLPNRTAARTMAADIIGQRLRDGSEVFWGTEPWTMTVTDESGVILFTIRINGAEPPKAAA